jgi:methyltransferase (TIGR00027 family)
MQNGHSSRTAEYNALFRDLETQRPATRRLFNDPLARRLLTWPLTAVTHLAAVPAGNAFVRGFIDRRWPGVRTSVVARTRLIDDTIDEAIDKSAGAAPDGGRWQFVTLGAGFDTRPHRLAALRTATIFEVDHPDTQRAKRDRLTSAHLAVRADIRYVPKDFRQNGLADVLVDAGYDDTIPAVIVWEGVTNYLTAEAVDATLRWCSTAAPASLLIFTYVHRDVLTNPSKYVGTGNLARSLARSGEQLTFGIDPVELPTYLAERSLSLDTDIGASEYRRRYYGDQAHDMHGHEFYRVAIANIGEKPSTLATQRPMRSSAPTRRSR